MQKIQCTRELFKTVAKIIINKDPLTNHVKDIEPHRQLASILTIYQSPEKEANDAPLPS